MARYTIGRILPIFQGDWDSTQTYDKLDIVLKDTISYVSLIDDNNTTPSESNSNWQVVCRGATAAEVVEAIEGGQLQIGRLDVDDDITASDIYVTGSIKIGGKNVATQDYVSNVVKYGLDEVSIDQSYSDRVRIDTTMIGGGGSSQSIYAATPTTAGVMSAADKTKLDAIVDGGGGEHPVEVEADGNGDLDVSDEQGYILGRFENGHIRTKNFYSGNIYTKSEVDSLIGSGGVTQQQLNTALATKQDSLVSGTNIKTINNQSILGSGNITVSGGEGGTDTPLHLKLLVLGNSYSYDSFMYVPFILRNYGITIEIGIFNRSNGAISDLHNEWDTATNLFAHIDTGLNDTAWTSYSDYSTKMAVLYTDWDIITIQQGSTASTSTPYNYVRTFINEIETAYREKYNKGFQLAWNINHNRAASGSDYTAVANTILSNIKYYVDTNAINIIFPYGTAVFNARTHSTLDALGDGGHLWASDSIHLQQGLPCYLAAITNVQTLFNKFYPKYSVFGDTLRPTDALDDEWNIRGQQGNCVGVSDTNCRLAQICAIVANRYNWEIKTII